MTERQQGLVADPDDKGDQGPWTPIPVKWLNEAAKVFATDFSSGGFRISQRREL